LFIFVLSSARHISIRGGEGGGTAHALWMFNYFTTVEIEKAWGRISWSYLR